MSSGLPPDYRPGFDNCHENSPICPVEASTYGDAFSLPGCIIFVVFHSIALIWCTVIGIRSRTWSFSAFLFVGIAFELMGYAARLAMTPIGTVWNYPAFVIQLLFLILGPTLIAAAISVTFKHIVLYLGVEYSVMRASLYPWVFVGTDFFSIIIQAVGGAVSATATSGETNTALLDAGSGLLTAGVAFQAANMAFCGGLMVIYWWRYRKDSAGRAERATARHTTGESSPTVETEGSGVATPEATETDAPQTTAPTTKQPNHGPAPSAGRFKKFIWALLVAYIAVLIRCIYRIPEMSAGWGSDIMQDEPSFLVLDGAMVAIAILVLCIFHPAFYFPILCKPKRGKKAKKTTEEVKA